MEETFLTPAGEKTILVVDDDAEMRRLLEMTLKTEGFQVVCAVDGRDAAAQVVAKTPDMIVTDLMMPNEGGYEFLRGLQASGASGVPVFVISAGNVKPTTIEMIRQEANVVDFIGKPLPMASFVASLHRVLKTLPPELARLRAADGPKPGW